MHVACKVQLARRASSPGWVAKRSLKRNWKISRTRTPHDLHLTCVIPIRQCWPNVNLNLDWYLYIPVDTCRLCWRRNHCFESHLRKTRDPKDSKRIPLPWKQALGTRKAIWCIKRWNCREVLYSTGHHRRRMKLQTIWLYLSHLWLHLSCLSQTCCVFFTFGCGAYCRSVWQQLWSFWIYMSLKRWRLITTFWWGLMPVVHVFPVWCCVSCCPPCVSSLGVYSEFHVSGSDVRLEAVCNSRWGSSANYA